ncbi:hypothetical protein SAMN06265377_2756 [Flagellimonas pacifica]|uniref:Uncharacterized protein n=1 Tax=Flagellimonas pacifica TaxID=1247520 RepID=A0A285MUZ2_9FLAO|nr:hypothetical protein SAMN06265377_2756 [Allomuricauda parva]
MFFDFYVILLQQLPFSFVAQFKKQENEQLKIVIDAIVHRSNIHLM